MIYVMILALAIGFLIGIVIGEYLVAAGYYEED